MQTFISHITTQTSRSWALCLILIALNASGSVHAAPVKALSSADKTAQTGGKSVPPLEEVVVTGSLLAAPKTQALPVRVWRAQDLPGGIPLRVSTLLETLPEVGRSPNSLATSGFSTVNGGLSSVDLRGLGPARTLVMLNGKRLVGGDPTNISVVDLNSIPTALIDRVEVYSGGATAIYGSGAVAGVINIITKKEFTGTSFALQTGASEKGDGTERSASITTGHSFAQQQGNVIFNLSWDNSDPIWAADRDFSKDTESLGNRQAYSQATPGGVFNSNAGLRVPNAQGVWTQPYTTLQQGYNTAQDRLLVSPLERTQGLLSLNYEGLSHTRLYSTLALSQNHAWNQQEPTPLSPSFALRANSPHIPTEILDTWRNDNKALPTSIGFSRRLNELGPRRYEQDRNSRQWVLGMENIFGDWQQDISLQLSRSHYEQISTGHYITANLNNALNIQADPNNSGNYRCTLEDARNKGCVPINLVAPQGFSAAAKNYIGATQFSNAQLNIQELQWRLQGPVLTLPAGEMQLLVGADFREEALESWVDANTAAGLTSAAALTPTNGQDDIREAYSELKIPLINEQFIHSMDVNLAYRLSDYDTVGAIHSWNTGLNLSPVQSLQLFARQSLAMRAPNVTELYTPERNTTAAIADPCAANAVVSAKTRENCQKAGIPVNYAPTLQDLNVQGRLFGNTQLTEEQAHTTLVGFNYDPFLDARLSLNSHWFDVDIEEAISGLNTNFMLSQCYAAEDFPNHPFCSKFIRGGQAQNYRITRFDSQPQNIGHIQTRGLDTELSSHMDLGASALNQRLSVTYTDQWVQQDNGLTLNRINEPGNQRWKAKYQISWALEPFNMSLSARYLGHGVIENNSTQPYILKNNHVPATTYWDTFFTYDFKLMPTSKQAQSQLFLGIYNLADKQPPYIPSAAGNRAGTTGTATAAGVYDVRGRFFRVGLTHHF